MTTTLMTGIVTQIQPLKGYGFVKGEADGLSRFFNAADVEPPRDFDLLGKGCEVRFEPATGDPSKGNGLRAVKVAKCS